ncbi:MAG TPA: hypothetical protein VFI69_01130 [Candidatus Limnocylindrales bacterium]|nr:hypothetical protein [Candidatus Limnocylindrales bacterium]
MHRLSRQLRGVAIAIAALALSAGFVLAARPAAMPDAARDGLARASAAAGTVVPVRPERPTAPEAPSTTGDEATTGAGDEPTTGARDDAASDTAADAGADNHGSFVSTAARGDTPEGFDNHGQYVRTIAQGDDGKPDAASTGQAASTKAHANKPTPPAPATHGRSGSARAAHP